MATTAKVIKNEQVVKNDQRRTQRNASHWGWAPGSLALVAASLDEIRSGTVYLSVSLLNETIQVGPTIGTIQVLKRRPQ
jgi:hypothetical protein